MKQRVQMDTEASLHIAVMDQLKSGCINRSYDNGVGHIQISRGIMWSWAMNRNKTNWNFLFIILGIQEFEWMKKHTAFWKTNWFSTYGIYRIQLFWRSMATNPPAVWSYSVICGNLLFTYAFIYIYVRVCVLLQNETGNWVKSCV